MTNEIISNGTEIDKAVIYAGSVMRFAANLIDFVIIGIVYALIIKIIGHGFFQGIITSIGIMLFYLGFWNKRQATLGKIVFSMKIVDETTLQPAKKEKYFLRFIVLYAPFLITLILDNLINSIFNNWKVFNVLFSSIFTILTLILVICFVSIFFSKNNQGLHDNLLGLAVIHD